MSRKYNFSIKVKNKDDDLVNPAQVSNTQGSGSKLAPSEDIEKPYK